MEITRISRERSNTWEVLAYQWTILHSIDKLGNMVWIILSSQTGPLQARIKFPWIELPERISISTKIPKYKMLVAHYLMLVSNQWLFSQRKSKGYQRWQRMLWSVKLPWVMIYVQLVTHCNFYTWTFFKAATAASILHRARYTTLNCPFPIFFSILKFERWL